MLRSRISRRRFLGTSAIVEAARQHKRNFLLAVSSRTPPAADALVGHRAALPGHLANISYRVGRKLTWDPTQETIPGDPEAAALLSRTYRTPYVI